MSSATLHSVAGPGHVTEAATLVATHRALVGPFARIVHRVSGPPEVIEEAAAGLPAGPAQAEAIAVRLRRVGVTLDWGAPDELSGPRELLGALPRARPLLGRGLAGRQDAPDRARARGVVPGRAPSSPHQAAPDAGAGNGPARARRSRPRVLGRCAESGVERGVAPPHGLVLRPPLSPARRRRQGGPGASRPRSGPLRRPAPLPAPARVPPADPRGGARLPRRRRDASSAARSSSPSTTAQPTASARSPSTPRPRPSSSSPRARSAAPRPGWTESRFSPGPTSRS